MRPKPFPAGLAVVVALVTACGSSSRPGPGTAGTPSSSGVTAGSSAAATRSTEVEDGTGALTVADLDVPPQPGHFTGAPAHVTARLAATTTGCVTVAVGGVTRMPFWPAGTRVEDSNEKPGNYTVSIPGGPTLKASRTTGDTFTADGVIDEEGRAFDAGGSAPDNKVASMLGFCAVRTAPIAFRDASTVTRASS